MKFWLKGEITEKSATKLIKEISECSEKRIVVYINSEGGCFNSSKYLHSFLTELDKDVVTVVVGDCASGAVLVALAGDERYATPLSRFMIHEAYDSELPEELEDYVLAKPGEELALGSKQYQAIAEACVKLIEECRKETDQYFKLIAQHSNLSVPRIRKMVEVAKDNDWYFSAKQALKMQIIDNLGLPDDNGQTVNG